MERKPEYGWLDRFRIVAAIIIVGIHTYPLVSVSYTANFVFVHILGRVAVPFFLMTTGYFLFTAYGKSAFPSGFLKKTAILYAIATLIYLPISIYAGHFSDGNIFAVIARIVVFDGTFYHLWYLPASIIGVIIVYGLTRKLTLHVVFGIASMLYIIGLLGDGYFGVTYQIPALLRVYETVFNISPHTRNGIFYAPIFLMLGAIIKAASYRPRPTTDHIHHCESPCQARDDVVARRHHILPILILTIILVAEGLLLYHFNLQRHTSMYISLIPLMYFIFRAITSSGGKSSPALRNISLWMFIIHPLVIIALRGGARLVGLTHIFVNNSMIHFATVCLLSAIAAIIIAKLSRHFKRKPAPPKTGRAWIELNTHNLRHNIQILKYHLPHDCQLMPAIKANAYGHGAVPIAKELNAAGIRAFCVATVLEGKELRKAGIKGEILILGYTHPSHFPLLVKHSLTQTVIDYDYAQALNSYGHKLSVHIAVDTGMRRLGEECENLDNILRILNCKNLIVSGIYSHLCTVDGRTLEDAQFAEKQIRSFGDLLIQIKDSGYIPPRAHIQSSYSVFRYPELNYDYARVGIALYGMLSTPGDDSKYKTSLKPVLSLKARISAIKTMEIGESAGYGLAFTATRETKLAALAIGYADGIPRGLSCGVGHVLVNGQKAPIAGRVCMDQMMVDVTGIDNVQQGDTVVIIGQDGSEVITACDIAHMTGTIANEVLSRLGWRLERHSNTHRPNSPCGNPCS